MPDSVCGDLQLHGRHEWIDGMVRRDCPGVSAVMSLPPMPDGFTDRAAWDAIHWPFSGGSLIDQAVIDWQRDNQDRCKAAREAESNA